MSAADKIMRMHEASEKRAEIAEKRAEAAASAAESRAKVNVKALVAATKLESSEGAAQRGNAFCLLFSMFGFRRNALKASYSAG